MKKRRRGVIRLSLPAMAGILLCCLAALWFGVCKSAAVRTAGVGSPSAEEAVQTLPIIMYHHLSENPEKLGDYTVSPAQFESDLQMIQSLGYTAISLAQLRDYYENGTPLPEKSVLITFDDGYYSVYVYAYPLLKKYDMPAISFILGYYTQMYSDGEKQNVAYAHMTWEQLREMRESGYMELGSHSYNLHMLKGQGKRYGISINAGEDENAYCDAVGEDLCTLSNRMYEELGFQPDAFAYPFGAICRQSYPLLDQMGFRFAFTCEEKVNCLCKADIESKPVLLGRFNRASRYSTWEFFHKMKMT